MRAHIVIKFLLGLFIFNSCQKELIDPNDTSVDAKADFKAKINGIQFIGTIFGAAIRTDSVISIAAQSADGQKIVFTVRDSGVHVYQLMINSLTNFGAYTDAHSIAFSSNEGYKPDDAGGNLAIISLDRVKKLISGTFNLKVFREDDRTQRTITEGSFNNIPY